MQLNYSESASFYAKIDDAVERNEQITICFGRSKPKLNSKLWKRLRQCSGWGSIEKELKKLRAGKPTPIRAIVSDSMVSKLSASEIALIAWIATLLAGVLFYAIYKNYNAKLRVNGKTKGGEIVLNRK